MENILEETACLNTEEIKRYLSEQSSKEELHRVENHLLDCPLCADAVEGLEGYYSFETDESLEVLNKAIADKEVLDAEESKVVTMRRRGKLLTFNRVAAAILLFLVPATTWLYLNNKEDASSFNFGDNGTLRSAEDTEGTDAALEKAISLYDARQFEAALKATQDMLLEDRENLKVTYYAGLSALKAEEYQLAADYFMTLRLNSDYYYEDASWLMVQACLGADDDEKAKLLLEEILNKEEGTYYDKALDLKRTLESK